jgi:outer membrane protein TolC
MKKVFIVFGGLLLVPLLLQGCVVRPQPLTAQAINSRIDADLKMITDGQEKISAPINLDEAVARALRYNLDYRLKLMEEALYQKNYELLSYDMLPKLIASAGYLDRSNDSGGTSVSITTGLETLEPSTSESRSRFIAGATFSWNILDFGISYYKAKQQADQFLIAQERRRKVIQNVIQDVRTAYYRAYAAQKLMKRCDDLLEEVNSAMNNTEEIERRGLNSPVSVLHYQRSLIETTTLLVQKRRELYLAKIELGALMNIPPGTDFEIADVNLNEPKKTPTDINKMEMVALSFRPELREEDYKGRISQSDAKKLILSALPGIELESALQYDTNKYLFNSNWVTLGARASWNLFRLLSLPATMEMNDAQDKVDNVRRAALTMAVITQVRIATQRYDMALYDYGLAQKASDIDGKLLKHSQSAHQVGMENRLEVIRTHTKALLSELQKWGNYANVQAAYARLLNSVGLDILPPATELKDVRETATLMQQSMLAWDNVIDSFSKDQTQGTIK